MGDEIGTPERRGPTIDMQGRWVIRVQPVPVADPAFRELVQLALATAGAAGHHGLVAEDEAMLRRALAVIRRECPGASARRQEPLAARNPGEDTWYVFRDGP